MEDVDSKLWELEREFWLGGADVYRRHLADDAVIVFPGMVMAKSKTVESIAAGPRWASVNFSDQRLVRLTPDAVALIYHASGLREHETSAYSAEVSSVYVQRFGSWELAMHQQSPSNDPK